MALALKLFLMTCILSCFQIMPVKHGALITISFVCKVLGITAASVSKQCR